MNKNAKMLAGIIVIASLSACKYDLVSEDDKNKILQSAAQVGHTQTVLQLIDQTTKKPCEPINLFNQVDKDNRIEVNLINMACDKISFTSETKESVNPEDKTETK